MPKPESREDLTFRLIKQEREELTNFGLLYDHIPPTESERLSELEALHELPECDGIQYMLPGKDSWPPGFTKLKEVMEQGLTPKRIKTLQMKPARGDKVKLWVTLWQGHSTLTNDLVAYLRSTLDNLRVALDSDEPLIDKMDLKIDSHGAF